MVNQGLLRLGNFAPLTLSTSRMLALRADKDPHCAIPQRRGRPGWWSGFFSVMFPLLVMSVISVSPSIIAAQEPDPSAAKKRDPLPIDLGETWVRATKDFEVWVDFKKKQVLLGGSVCLREGMLEMFACPQGTKEHESVVSVNSPASFVHAALMAIGAKPGPTVQFQPEYRPAGGTEVEVTVVWKDPEGKEHRVRAQEWVKHNPTGKPLEYPWVFAGSGFWKDEGAGERYYYADGGELICVSNFSTAMLDLPVASSDANDSLMFSAFTEHIPPRGTRVCLILTPKLDAKEQKDRKATEPAKGASKPAPAAESSSPVEKSDVKGGNDSKKSASGGPP